MTRLFLLTFCSLKKRLLAIGGAALLLCGTAHAASWWNEDWTLRKKITIDTAAAGIKEDVGTATILLRLHDGNFQFGAAKEDAGDIRFVAMDDKTLLPYHIERFDGLLNEAFVWVKVPDIKPNAQTSFWLYYGNGGPKAVRVEDAKGSYDGDTVLAYHFGERGAPPSDATGLGNNGQGSGIAVDGSIIAGGVRLTGHNPITIAPSATLDWAGGSSFTWASWIKYAAPQAQAEILSRKDGNQSFVIGLDNGVPYVQIGANRSVAGEAASANAWHHLAVTVASSKVTIYLDGEVYRTLDASLPNLNSPVSLGGDGANGTTGYAGELDEMEMSKTARSPGYIKLLAADQGGGDKAAKLVLVGEDAQMTSWFSFLSTGYFGIIIKSLTVDGWVVICILGLMAALSWFVMISKNSYINGIAKGNKRFMQEWHQLAADISALDCEDPDKARTLGGRVADKSALRSLRSSSIYRIYHTGVEEIRNRLKADDAQGDAFKVLSSRSMQAIRASMDGSLVREQQKLNRMIVFLTLSISGGPFLGLLGTVVGVMITFAAVAAAGDVNVNAIAPGIAAALLATVAGLAVAIPALFGYNYLLSRIKDAMSDMHVFIDEFVTRIAEQYRD